MHTDTDLPTHNAAEGFAATTKPDLVPRPEIPALLDAPDRPGLWQALRKPNLFYAKFEVAMGVDGLQARECLGPKCYASFVPIDEYTEWARLGDLSGSSDGELDAARKNHKPVVPADGPVSVMLSGHLELLRLQVMNECVRCFALGNNSKVSEGFQHILSGSETDLLQDLEDFRKIA